jgi:hypothetical protein
MKVDTADSKGKWLVRVPIRIESLDSRSRLGVSTSWVRVREESAESPREAANRWQKSRKAAKWTQWSKRRKTQLERGFLRS